MYCAIWRCDIRITIWNCQSAVINCKINSSFCRLTAQKFCYIDTINIILPWVKHYHNIIMNRYPLKIKLPASFRILDNPKKLYREDSYFSHFSKVTRSTIYSWLQKWDTCFPKFFQSGTLSYSTWSSSFSRVHSCNICLCVIKKQ